MTHSFRETMKDLKFKEKLSGLGGVDSIICESRKEDWKTIDKIPESFPITHSAERAQSVYINNSYTKKMVKLKRNKEITRNAMDWLENTHFIWPTLHTYRPFCISMFWAGFSKYSVQLILWVLERKTDYHWRTHKKRQKKKKKKTFNCYYGKKKGFLLPKCLGQMIKVVHQTMGIRQGDFSASILLMPLLLVCQ